MVNLALDHIIRSQFGSEEQGGLVYDDVRNFQGYMSANCEVLRLNSTLYTMS